MFGQLDSPLVAAVLVVTEGYGPETKTVVYYLGLDPSPAISEPWDLGQVIQLIVSFIVHKAWVVIASMSVGSWRMKWESSWL